MAERKDFSRYNMRCGMILRSEEGERRLDGFDIPELDSRFLVIRAEDIPGNNEINVFGTSMPLLASDYIAYKGQPLLVLFGPDYENTELALERIKVRTSEAEKKEDEESFDSPDPLFFSWGIEDNAESEEERREMKKVESSFTVDGGDMDVYVRFPILAQCENNGNIRIECPTQWQTLVRETVASALQKSPETINVISNKCYPKNDEYLLGPAHYAAFVAVAAEKTGLTCEMREEGIASRTSITYHTTTWLDKNNKPKHEEVSVAINQGAWAIAGKELQRQTMVSLIPKYSLESFKADIRTELSPRRPSLFCGSMVTSAAASARAIHTSRLAAKTGVTPSRFITETNKDATRFTDWAPRHDLTELEEKVKAIAALSDFDRKWSSTALHSGQFGLQGYLYGIGLSSSLSVAGFSTTMAKENQFMAQVTYTQKKNITVSGSVPAEMSQDRALKEALAAIFAQNDQAEPVLFIDNQQKTMDSGPDLLSSYSSLFVSQLAKGTGDLSGKVKIKNLEPPVTVKFNSQNLSMPCEFEYSGFGTAVVEVVIPKVSLIPEVSAVWIDCAMKLPYTKGVKERIRSLAILALSEEGIKLSDKAEIMVTLSSERKEVGTYSSPENLVKALVTSALASALWQATGSKGKVSMPMDDRKIEARERGVEE